MKELAEMMKLTFYRSWGEGSTPEDKNYGTLLPAAEGHYGPPSFKKKEIYETEEFEFTFSKKEYAKYPKIDLETFNLDFEVARKGVYTNINNLTSDKDELSEKNIISLGLAKDTKVLKK